MTDDRALNAKTFFKIGIAFSHFATKPDKEKYKIVCKIISPLKLEIPDYDELLVEQRDGVLVPPKKWFEGLEGESMRNYYRIGVLSSFLYLFNGQKKIYKGAVQELRVLFQAESIPTEVLDDYLTDLILGDKDDALRFQSNFLKAISKKYTESEDVNTEDRLKFNALESAPSFFQEDVVGAIDYTLEEASVCYENQCYQATIMLCGKVMEMLIKHVYKPVTKNEIYTIKKGEQIERTFKQMCYDLRSEGILLSRGVGERLDIIYAHRSGAAHESRIPSEDEAGSVALLTNDVMNRIFEYCNTHPQS